MRVVRIPTYFLQPAMLATTLAGSAVAWGQPLGEASQPKEDKAQPTSPTPAAADTPASPEALRLPVAISTPVEAVAGGWNSAQVVLELKLSEKGDVTDARLIRGAPPFSRAALKAAPAWKFAPAQRGGKPVAAKIHFLLEFSQQATLPKREERAQQPDPSSPRPMTVEGRTLEEVVVLGEIPDMWGTEITRKEANNIAGAFGDPFRAIEGMPGVTAVVSGLPFFFVRGAPPGNVGYFVDGMRVPLLYHGFLGPAVIHPAFIDKVRLSAGPYETEFGRFAGAAVEAELSETKGIRRAEASVRLIDAGGFAESPFADGRGHVQVAGRYSYTALLLSAFSPGTRLDYWDYQARAGYQVGKKGELRFFGLGAFDYAGIDGEVLAGTEFHRANVGYRLHIGRVTNAEAALTFGWDRTRSDTGFISDTLVGARFKVEHQQGNTRIRGGADGWVDTYRLDVDPFIEEPEVLPALFPERTDITAGAWVDLVVQASSALRIIPGVRGDVFRSLGTTRASLDPRLATEYQLTKKLKAIHSVGVAHQSPNFVPNVPGAQVGGLQGGLQRSLQASTKYEARLPSELTASIAGYINGTERLTDPIGLDQSFDFDETSNDQRALGRAFGLELYVKRALTRRLGGFISYTFSKSLRSLAGISTSPGYDRSHVFNGAVSYEIGAGFRTSAKLALGSGILGRRTTLQGFVFDQSRSGPYARLDLKVEKRFTVSEHFDWGIHLEVLNATNTGNVTTRACSTEGCENRGTAPITLPSLGADFAWH